MKKISIFLILVFGILMLCIPLSANAYLMYYFDRITFNVAAPGLPVEDFEEGIRIFGNYYMEDPLDKYTSNDFFSPGDIQDGLRIQSMSGNGLLFAFMSAYKSVSSSVSDDGLILTFYNNNVTAVGMQLIPFEGTSMMIEIAITREYPMVDYFPLPWTNESYFFGVISTEPNDLITAISLSGGYYPNIDDIAFGTPGTPVPEPTTMLLLGSGLLGLLGLRRKCKK